MDTKQVYSTKAEKYASYRWDYAPQAIETIFEITGLSAGSAVADLGAGTGILTRHFCGRVGQVIAIEPNSAMRGEATRCLAGCVNCRVLGATAEATALAGASLDLITVGQAIHWFDPEPAKKEFLRILKRGGWLALLRNLPAGSSEISVALQMISTPEYGVQAAHSAPANHISPGFYFGHEGFLKYRFPFSFQQDWDAFIGSICSASNMPDERHPLFPKFESAARALFDRYTGDGYHTVRGETELLLGRPV